VGDFGDELCRAEKLDEPSHLYASLLGPSVVVTDIEHVAAGDRIGRERNARLAVRPQFSPQPPFKLVLMSSWSNASCTIFMPCALGTERNSLLATSERRSCRRKRLLSVRLASRRTVSQARRKPSLVHG
jgi:hypothetical protein